ncbi:hypothetical protein K7640_27560 [Micromonospora sp. PLK6-60]|uniref:LppU/SCO3897 family protein n=1 Tax=Micromonospora sp. PLK6-60 TaxID=2873383 RepID=UPI001CA71F09|nr:hypothetical protein [Micromonospora sp. PLK6-60]MBY8875593.1 hypothetical protein [Micromonospora sp. PLK6-60]
MTSEGPHRPGQEPDEVSPGAGGPAPYGDRPAQQNSPYGSAPDLGWAPPPPGNQPQSPAPAWAAQNDQPPATASWGSASVPAAAPAQPGTWGPAGGTSQAAWASQQEQTGAWAAGGPPAADQGQPGWAQQAEPAPPAWPQTQPAARGAAQVPSPANPAPGTWTGPDDAAQSGGWPATSEDPARSGGWPAPTPQAEPAQSGAWEQPAGAQDDAARSGGWPAEARQDDAARSGGWPAPTPQAEPAQPGGWNAAPDEAARSGGWPGATSQDDPARSGGWEQPAEARQDDAARSGGWPAEARQDDQPAWGQPAEVAPAAWPQAQPAARGAAQVPQPAPDAGSDDPERSGGWRPNDERDEAATSGGWAAGQEDPARSGGWTGNAAPDSGGRWPADARDEDPRSGDWSTDAREQDPARSGGWTADARDEEPARSGGWSADAHEQDPARSGGWAADARQDDAGRSGGWDGAAQDDSATSGGWAAGSPPAERPEATGWTQPEPTSAPPVRAAAAVAGNDGPPAWGGPAGDGGGQWGAERPAQPTAAEVEPWAPGAAWGRQEAEPAADNGWEARRADEPPAYQPGPAPGISAANAVPLPPQEQRVPGASLAAAPPADYQQPAQYNPFEQPGRDDAGPGHPNDQAGWPGQELSRDEPQSPAAPVVPGPRTSPEAGSAGRASVPGPEGGASASASGSASVPMASRVLPPADDPLPGGTPPPQPRVYGRPARPEPDDEPGQGESGHEHGGQPRFDDQARPPAARAYAAAAAVPAGPPAPPAFPPGMPSFTDPAGDNRPVNGVRPHADERPGDPYRAAAPVDGTQPYGQPPVGDQQHHQGGFPPAFPGAQQPGPAWGAPPEPEQGRFDSFKPEAAEAQPEQPAPKVRNGRVLALVLLAAALILAVPLGLLALLGKIGGDDAPKPASFNPAVGSCVKQSGSGAATADCADADAFKVVARVASKDKCADPGQPHVVLPGEGADRVLCLKKAAAK